MKKTSPIMRIKFILLLAVVIHACSSGSGVENLPNAEVIELGEQLRDIISKQAAIEVLADGFNWSEGPVWISKGDYLLFSDVPENRIYKWDPSMGISIFLEPSGYTGNTKREGENGSNGLLIDQNGDLLLCQHGDRRVARLNTTFENPQPDFETIVQNYKGKKFNSPNDIVEGAGGHLFFTDPPYGLPKNPDSKEIKELDFQGVYRVDPDGSVSLLHDGLTRPNGIGLSPDQKALYVANSDPSNPVIMKFNLDREFNADAGTLFFDTSKLTGPGLPDGMAVSSTGTVFATGPGGVLVIDPNGKHLGTIYTGEATANVALDTNEEYLYITADSYLLRVKLQ